VRFEWDDWKAARNLKIHGVALEDAELVFEDIYAIFRKDRVVDGEQRWHIIGLARETTLLLVVHTVRYEDEEVVRIISARKTERRERKDYQESISAR
jgi:uncharacterized DUF497 family protein